MTPVLSRIATALFALALPAAAVAASNDKGRDWTQQRMPEIRIDITGANAMRPVPLTREGLRNVPPMALQDGPAGSLGITPDVPLGSITIPYWVGRARVPGGRAYRVIQAGGDPTVAGAGTTTITMVVIPVRLIFGNGFIDASAPTPCSPNTPLNMVAGSPLLNNVTITLGANNLGTSQYTDLFQRANYWSFTGGGASPNYHVKLNPVLGPTLTLIDRTASIQTAGATCGGYGLVAYSFLNSLIRTRLLRQLPSYGFDSTTFPLFLFYDTYFPIGSGFACGYHAGDAFIQVGRTWTYGVGSYTDNTPAINQDVQCLSHEVGEWMDNPFAYNITPAWGHVGQVTGCQANLEVGDPLTGTSYFFNMPNGFTYHVQDLAFTSWFFRFNPSIGVNGQYSLYNNLALQGLCS